MLAGETRRAAGAAEIVRGARETVGAFTGGEPEDDLTLVLLKGL